MASPSPEDAVLTANGVDHAGVAEAVERFFGDGRKVLFASAGVSSRAGLPVWGDLVTRLAAKVADSEPRSAELMRVRAADGRLPESFNVFRDVVRAPQGSLYSWIREALDPPPDAHALRYLLRLPFEFFATTSFDWSIANAWALEHESHLRTADTDRQLNRGGLLARSVSCACARVFVM